MSRTGTTITGRIELSRRTISMPHQGLQGRMWALAPLDSTNFGTLDHHGRAASQRECLWAAMSDGHIWYVDIDVATGQVLSGYQTPQTCPAPTREDARPPTAAA